MNGWLEGEAKIACGSALLSLLDKSVYRDTYTAVVSRRSFRGFVVRASNFTFLSLPRVFHPPPYIA